MTHYDNIYEVAADNYGLITAAQAKELGISDKEMSALAKRGRLVRRGHGVYRLAHHVPTPNDAYAEAAALVGPDAYLYGETVIAMLGLAPTNPARLFVATPVRVRKALPQHIVLVKANGEATCYDGIPSQKVPDAIRACKRTIMPDRLIEAVSEARRQGFITDSTKAELLKDLEIA
ncbi:MAG: type IV toxin-antitoxin system AbiEi family antitoxin domain-containing protein [Coriobacteriia bacterium]|nr:type IV toxin-antitoxin system AbiEi family antitoxin domain-containing protein [Coriobacteriia bacterium]